MIDIVHGVLLLDTSASMTGAPLESLKQGVHLLQNTFASRSTRPVLISAIAYESTAKVLFSMVEVQHFSGLPALDAAGSSALGKGLRLMMREFEHQKPMLVYIFTDGEPNDAWESALSETREYGARVYGMACGLHVSDGRFMKVVDEAFWLGDLTPDTLLMTLHSASQP